MPETFHDLLGEPLFGILDDEGQRESVSLPALLARLSARRPTEYTALQVHQQHPWHSFLVQLAAIALHTAHSERPPGDQDRWRALLLNLTGSQHEPWCLIVKDLKKPALLQPPVPEDKLEGFKNRFSSPDGSGIDLLLTTRNHDVKFERAGRAAPEHWAYALVTLQTQQGFSGRDNYGIARMNGGFASRPHTAYAPSLEWAERFARDLGVLLAARPAVVEQLDYPDQGGLALLWLLPWDGKSSAPLSACDPWFIEVCRRVRLVREGEDIVALCAPSKFVRLSASHAKGNTGDPWTPVSSSDGKALTVGASSSFSYRLVADLLLSGEYRPGSALVLHTQDGDAPLFLASALARGRGKTEGLHERVLPVPRRARELLASRDGRDRLHQIARVRLQVVSTVQYKVLKPALCALLQGDPEKLKLDDDRPRAHLAALDRAVDRVFFERLWDDVELDAAVREQRWSVFVLDLARNELEQAIESSPLPSARRFRAIAGAERLFEISARKHFPHVFEKEESAL